MGDGADVQQTAALRAEGLARGWTPEQIVAAIAEEFTVSQLKAHRLARGWTRPRAVEAILATYDADGLARPGLTTGRLCHWEHGKARPGEEYLDRLCRVYETRADLLGYGCDYAPAEPPQPVEEPLADYAGRDTQADDQETDTDRRQLFRAAGATGVSVALEQSGLASMRLSRKLEKSNVGPFTLEHLELRVASFLRSYEHTPSGQMLRAVSALRDEVEALLDGKQTLVQRRALYRIAGQLSALLGFMSFELGDYPVAYAHLLTAEQLAREVGDDTLLASVRVDQSTVALWDEDFPMALSYAQDGQRYATNGAQRALLAVRGEARALARMSDRLGVFEALGRAERELPSHQPGDDPIGGWWSCSPGGLQLYTGISLLWLGQPQDAEPHTRQAIACYQTASPPFAVSSNLPQSQINLAICHVHQGHPEEAIRLATDALAITRGIAEPNLQQANELLTTLTLHHRHLPATRDFADHLHTLRTNNPD